VIKFTPTKRDRQLSRKPRESCT